METRFTARRQMAIVLALCLSAAIAASHVLAQAGLTDAGHALANSASGAFLHSLHGGCAVAGGVVIAGLFLPARPGREPRAQVPSPSGDPSLQTYPAPRQPDRSPRQ